MSGRIFEHIYIYILYADILSHIYSDILSGILSDIYSDILSGNLSGTLSDINSGILSGTLSDIYSDILSGILSDSDHLATYSRLRSGREHITWLCQAIAIENGR